MSACADFVHTVMPGESLSSIAASDGLSVDQLAAANGLPSDAQLIVGSTIGIPAQSDSTAVAPAAPTTTAPTGGDGDCDADDAPCSSGSTASGSYVVQPGDTLTAIAARAGVSVSSLAAANGLDPGGVLPAGTALSLSGSAPAPAAAASTSAAPSGSYVVQPGDTLSAIAARAGVSVDSLAAANGLDPNGVLPAGADLNLSSASAALPSQAPAVGTTITGRMTWFGGPDDPSAQGAPASGLGWQSNGMAYYNTGSLGRNWVIHFPWGQTMPMKQIDIGPAPWTGNPFDIAFSALPNTPYNESNWPNPTVTGTYVGP